MPIERIPLDDDRDAWLATRSGFVNASEMATVCGEASYGSLAELYAEKKGLRPPLIDSGVLRRGRWGEAAVFQALADLFPDGKSGAPTSIASTASGASRRRLTPLPKRLRGQASGCLRARLLPAACSAKNGSTMPTTRSTALRQCPLTFRSKSPRHGCLTRNASGPSSLLLSSVNSIGLCAPSTSSATRCAKIQMLYRAEYFPRRLPRPRKSCRHSSRSAARRSSNISTPRMTAFEIDLTADKPRAGRGRGLSRRQRR